jgi:hypothetical protein
MIGIRQINMWTAIYSVSGQGDIHGRIDRIIGIDGYLCIQGYWRYRGVDEGDQCASSGENRLGGYISRGYRFSGGYPDTGNDEVSSTIV